jgi:hypothetical protein
MLWLSQLKIELSILIGVKCYMMEHWYTGQKKDQPK